MSDSFFSFFKGIHYSSRDLRYFAEISRGQIDPSHDLEAILELSLRKILHEDSIPFLE